jgi:predicted RNase H-related nuclease YkuK (DUF458 family)
MDLKAKFKRFGGEHIDDITQYLKEYIETNPSVTISVGCDSIQKKRRTVYAVTIMLHDSDIRRGAHVVFFRESLVKIRDNFERLQKEAQFVLDVGNFLEEELASFYQRKDLTIAERRRYKWHMIKSVGDYSSAVDEYNIVRNIPLTDIEEKIEYKFVDLHLDFNPLEAGVNSRGSSSSNKSNLAYKTFVPWLRGMGFRVWSKPNSHASSSAADLLVQD